MDTHEVVRKTHRRSSSQSSSEDAGEAGWTEFQPGDEITPTDDELEAFPDRFREIRVPEPETSEESGDEETEEPPLDLTEMTIADVEEALETGDYDDSLDTLEEYEDGNDDRSGVYQLIDGRRE